MQLPFDRPFDKLTVLSKIEGLRCASSLVTVAYWKVCLIPKDSRALHPELFTVPSDV